MDNIAIQISQMTGAEYYDLRDDFMQGFVLRDGEWIPFVTFSQGKLSKAPPCTIIVGGTQNDHDILAPHEPVIVVQLKEVTL